MPKREYSFYPGCSSQKGASSSNYLISVKTMCEELEIQLNEIPDWNCCAASIGYAGGGELPGSHSRHATSHSPSSTTPVRRSSPPAPPAGSPPARPPSACTRTSSLLAECNTALAEAGLKLKNATPIKHMAEVLVEDLG